MRQGDLMGLRVAVTGAASGIGRATAVAFAQGGAELILADIDRVGLKRTSVLVEGAGGKVLMAEMVDVSDRKAMEEFAGKVERVSGGLDVLVNNAGIGAGGNFVDTELDVWDKVFAINVMGVVHGCKFFLPQMLERGQGHVVNVASILGLVGVPRVAAYAASKFAVVGLSRSLMCEVQDKGVHVTAICPGLIATDIMAQAPLSGAMAHARESIKSTFRKGAPPETVASAIVRAVTKQQSRVVPVTSAAKAAHIVDRLVPRLSRRFIELADRLQGRGNKAEARSHSDERSSQVQ